MTYKEYYAIGKKNHEAHIQFIDAYIDKVWEYMKRELIDKERYNFSLNEFIFLPKEMSKDLDHFSDVIKLVTGNISAGITFRYLVYRLKELAYSEEYVLHVDDNDMNMNSYLSKVLYSGLQQPS